MTNKDGFNIQNNMADIIDLPSLPQLPQPNIPSGQKIRVNGKIFIAANVNGNWDWCAEKKPEDICKEKPVRVIEHNNPELSACRELKDLCEKKSAYSKHDPTTIMVCEDDPSHGTMNIRVELVIGVSDLFDVDICSDSKSPCKEQKGSKSDDNPNTIKGFTRETLSANAIKQFENWVLVIDQGKTNKTVTGQSGSDPKQLKFPMEYSLRRIGTAIADIIKQTDDPCSNIACETYKRTRTAPLQLLSIDIPLYQSCKASSELTGQTLLSGALYQAMGACGNFFYNQQAVTEAQLEELTSDGSTAPQAIKEKAARCKAALNILKAHPCWKFLVKPLPDKNKPMGAPESIIDDLKSRSVLCTSRMKEILCREVISTREEKNPVPVPTPTADGGLEYRSRINTKAYIKSTNDGAQECFQIPTSIEMSRNGDNVVFTVVAGHECKPDDGQYTADKLTYALIKTKIGYDWTSNDFDHDHDYCKVEDPECKNVSINVEYEESQGRCLPKSPTSIIDILTGDDITQNGKLVTIPNYSARAEKQDWYQGDYQYIAYKCKKCEDLTSEIEKIKNNISSQKGYCCQAKTGKEWDNSKLAYISKSLCCDIYTSTKQSEISSQQISRQFFIPSENDTDEARLSARRKCFPDVDCCMPGTKNGGLCIYKPRFKPSVKFKITTDIKLCSIDEQNNFCNQNNPAGNTPSYNLGTCKLRKPDSGTYKMLIGSNQDFNYKDLLSNVHGIADDNLRSRLERYRACEGKSSGATYCQKVETKEKLVQAILAYMTSLGLRGVQEGIYKLVRKDQCENNGGTWNSVDPEGPANAARRSLKSSCKDLMDGPKTQTVTAEIQLEDVPTSKDQLSPNELINIINANDRFKNRLKVELGAAIRKHVTFRPAVCELNASIKTSIFGSSENIEIYQLYGCMNDGCCKVLLKRALEDKGYTDAQIEQALGSMEHRQSSGSFLCDNYPNQPNILEPTPPNEELSGPVLPVNWNDASPTVNFILADNNRYKITDIEVFPPKYTNKNIKSEYIPGVTPAEGNDQCKIKANEYLNTDNASSPKDYIFVPSYTKIDQVNAIVDSNENIVVDPTPPVPGSCDTIGYGIIGNDTYYSAETRCLKKGGKVVDNCNKCGQDEPRPDFPPPDDPPPPVDPNDPKDPNDPSNPPTTPSGKTKATLRVSVPIQNKQGAIISNQTLSFNIDLPIVVNGRTYKSLDVARKSKIVLRAVLSTVAPDLTSDQLDGFTFVSLQEK